MRSPPRFRLALTRAALAAAAASALGQTSAPATRPTSAPASSPGGLPVLSVPTSAGGPAPSVTADPADPAWAGAAFVPTLGGALRQPPAAGDVSTQVRVRWDPSTLYLRFHAADGERYTPVRGRDAELYRGDVVEVFLDSVGDGRQYVELQVSPNNDVFDQVILLTAEPASDADRRLTNEVASRDFWTFPEWTCEGLRTATSIADDGSWTVDMAIPAKSLLRRTGRTTFAANTTLRANFVRYDWVPPATDAAGKRVLRAFNWSPVVHGCPHLSPRAMGELRLSAAPHAKGVAPPTAAQLQMRTIRTGTPMTTTPSTFTPADPNTVGRRLAQHLAPHPRLMVTDADLAAARDNARSDPMAAAALEDVTRSAAELLDRPLLTRVLEGRRLLRVSREAMARVVLLAMAYRIDGDERFLTRCREELLNVAAFEDFNPSEFLDAAEMTAALALGLDWLHDQLTPDERARLRRAILDKGIAPSYDPRYNRWLEATYNWNAVCHGGLTMGALAIAEDEPAVAREVVARALACSPPGLRAYAPDGAYPEGLGYWSYGTSYLLMLSASLDSALGTDFGLEDAPGVMRSGDFFLHGAGPTGQIFAYSDARVVENPYPSAAQLYLAVRRGEPWLAYGERSRAARLTAAGMPLVAGEPARFLPLLIRGLAAPAPTAPPPALFYAGDGDVPVAFHRSGWDGQATFVGIKGGSARAGHAHMDAGAFVIDARGVRWVTDLGMQDYHSLESRKIDIWDFGQDSPRWDVFRMGPQGHSVMMVDGQRLKVDGRATLIASTPAGSTLDLTPAYAGQLARAHRSIAIEPDRSVVLEDSLLALPDRPASVRWAFVTDAEPRQLNDGSLELRKDGETMRVRVDAPAEGQLEVLARDPQPRDHDAPNLGVRIVGLTLRLSSGQAGTIRVRFHPGEPGGSSR